MKFTLRTEYRSQTLWYFVFFAFGAAFYFGLPCEPPYWMFFIPVTFLLFLFIKKHLCMWGLLFFLSFGLLIAATHTHFIQTKFLQFPARQKQITGQVANAYFTSKGQIAVLNELQIEDSPITLSNIRISLKGATPPLQAGDSLRFIATLYPPQPNQALRFFYQGIEAQGQLIKILEHTPATPSLIAKIRSNCYPLGHRRAAIGRQRNLCDLSQSWHCTRSFGLWLSYGPFGRFCVLLYSRIFGTSASNQNPAACQKDCCCCCVSCYRILPTHLRTSSAGA